MALTNVREFTLSLDQFVEETEGRRRDITKAVTLYGLRGVVLGTRVDTGRARGNWQVGESEPPVGFEPDTFDPSGQVTLSDGAQAIGAASGDDIIWLHNGVPYAEVLEQWDGMVVGTYEAMVTWLRSQS